MIRRAAAAAGLAAVALVVAAVGGVVYGVTHIGDLLDPLDNDAGDVR